MIDDPEREKLYLDMIAAVPDSPLPWFSLGRFYLETGAYQQAAEALRRCVSLQADYSAAWMALGEAYAASESTAEARDAYQRCEAAARAQGHPSLADEAAEKRSALPG